VDPHAGALGVLQLLRGLALGRLDRAGQHLAQRLEQPRHLLVVELAGDGERRELRRVQRLVAVGVADAGQHGLLAQQALHLLPGAGQDRREPRQVEVRGQRVGAERRDRRHLLRRADQVDGEALLRAGLGEVEAGLGALGSLVGTRRRAVEAHAQRDRALAGPHHAGGRGVVPAQPAGAREVEDQVDAVDVDVQPLAVAVDAGDAQAEQGGRRRVVGLEDADRPDVDPRDRAADQPLAQEAGERLDLGQFGHDLTVAPPPRRDHARQGRPRRWPLRSCGWPDLPAVFCGPAWRPYRYRWVTLTPFLGDSPCASP
jgi:hypothetical protein